MPGARLGLEEREELRVGLEMGESYARIGGRIGRPASTVWREVRRYGLEFPGLRYRGWHAQVRAVEAGRRPQGSKLDAGRPVRDLVLALLRADWSPQQIAGRLSREFAGQPEMCVSHETIYQALFVQGRGSLRAELATAVRCKRTRRKPRTRPAGGRPGQLGGMVNIIERPAEAADRAVPGHWEGDLIIGAGRLSAIATVVERTSRFTMLIALPEGRTAEAVSAALAAKITDLPGRLWRSLTWDQGKELARHAKFTVDTGIPVYFCDPHSPWQRGTNENTNGLVRYYYPKHTADFRDHSQADLDAVAHRLNTRPRKTLDYQTPAERLSQIIVATGG